MKELEIASAMTESNIRSLDNKLVDLLQIRAGAWATRAAVGAASIVLNKAATTQQPLAQDDLVTLMMQNGRSFANWDQVRNLVDHPTTDRSLKDSFNTAENTYFKGPLWDLVNSMHVDLADGRSAMVDLKDWLPASSKGQASVADVALVAMKLLDEKAEPGAIRSRGCCVIPGHPAGRDRHDDRRNVHRHPARHHPHHPPNWVHE
ncbi:hypothetical protein [Agrobacterium sp. 22-226-1]